MKKIALMAAAAIVLATSALTAQQAAPKNLKVLPKDMPRPQVIQIMRGFTRALGVRCQHCHVGEGDDISKFDFASDDKAAKEVARKMLTMVMEINGKHLAGVGEPPAAGASKVTCYTCHRGTTKPLTAAPAGEGRGGGAKLR
jgi:photosynthetic reaction center cytochrome c subunit